MQLSAATWSGDDSELNLAPGQGALSSPNYCVQRLGGCNNYLKGEIKAPLNGALCSRPHLMPCGLFKLRRGRRFKCLPPQPGRLQWAGSAGCTGRAGGDGEEALLRGVAGTEQPRRSPAHRRCPRRHLRPGEPGGPRWVPPPLAGGSRGGTVGGGRYADGRRARGRRGTVVARAAFACATVCATRHPQREGPSPDAPVLSPQSRRGTGRPCTVAAPGSKRRRAAAPYPGGPARSSRPRSCRSWSGSSASSATSAPARSGAWPPCWTSPRARWARPRRPGRAPAPHRARRRLSPCTPPAAGGIAGFISEQNQPYPAHLFPCTSLGVTVLVQIWFLTGLPCVVELSQFGSSSCQKNYFVRNVDQCYYP